MLELKAIFHGRVQGVGFRQTTYRLARAIGLSGTVKNCSNGTVELIAQGGQKELDQLLSDLDEVLGTHLDRERVEITFQTPQRLYGDFTIST